jgi:autotransporter-associated beta strand protein
VFLGANGGGNYTLSGGTALSFPISSKISVNGQNPTIATPITDTAGLVVAPVSGNTLTLSGIISGAGGLTQDDAGTTILTAANTYSGITTINSGILQVGNGGATGTLGTGSIVNNARLNYNLGGVLLTLPTTANYSGTGDLNASAGGIAFAGNLNVGGAFTFADGTGSYGASAVSATVTASSASFTGMLGYAAGNTSTFTMNTSAANGAITINNLISGTGGVYFSFDKLIFNAGSGSINLTGTNTFDCWTATGVVTFIGQLTGNGSMGYDYCAPGPLVITMNNPGSSTYSGVITGASYRLVKSGAGKQIISGAQNYTGTTTVSAGELQMNAVNIGSSTKTVASGGTLSGTGTIVGAATVSSGGKIRGGTGSGNAGVLTNTGTLTMSAVGSILEVCSDGVGLSRISVSSTITASAGFTVNLIDPMPAGTFTLISKTGALPATLPTLGINNSGRAVTFSWLAGTGLRVTLI